MQRQSPWRAKLAQDIPVFRIHAKTILSKIVGQRAGGRYFVSTILQFQIHRALCERTGQFIPGDPSRPLHKCDIYRNPEAGRILTRIMQRGSSLPWSQLLQETIGEGRLNGDALRDYFRPLEDWLRSENLRTGEYLGWSYDGDYCKFSIETAGLQVYGGFYNAASGMGMASFITLLLSSAITVVGIRLR
ncbi:angiotensin-converting enzyme-like protein Ace3 [Melitaea cinxia]|uniref:angiotensin-converting enzyme-like protein Ace3 n=1 Tax=Melitaea cinxia TaxID=113334 RepID=UPI001E270B38|nr:angiotensin-converting enzyme-like protein Ace3 [Melitaea cinxia]